MSSVVILSDATFGSEVLESQTPVLVDFWAPWCGPCLVMAPVLEDIAVKWEERLRVAKLDVDDNMAAARRYGIMTIPTLILFTGGRPIERIMGVVPKSEIEKRLRNALS